MVPLCRLRESLGSKVEVLERKGMLEEKTHVGSEKSQDILQNRKEGEMRICSAKFTLQSWSAPCPVEVPLLEV